jgi:protein SCO1
VRRLLAAAAGVLLLGSLAACGGSSATADSFAGTVVDPPFVVKGTELEDTSGAPYSLTESTDKRLTLVFFGYSNCPDICQTVMGNLASAMNRLDAADKADTEVVFVTTDPERDTPEALRKWLDHYDTDFIGVTADPSRIEEISQVAASIAVGMGDRLPTGGYDVDAHTTQVTAIDVDDQAPMYWSQFTSSPQFAHDIHALLNG